MRRHAMAPILALCAGLLPGGAMAATFDGRWTAEIPAQGNCANTGTMVLMVLDGDIQGQVRNPRGNVGVVGKVDADGNGTITVARAGQGTIRFSGDRFEADWPNNNCNRHAGGGRAPDERQQNAAVAARKQHQDSFAELVRRANAGETVDYTRLRADYVHNENWDFYGTRTTPLMNQANLAARGKDCQRALQITAQILGFDFTIDGAHAIRAECLKDSDPARARIEEAIADGLIHSLMDSGDGKSEKTAYVVVTQREEADVLANRRIQVRTKQTAAHGSDGRTFDIIEGAMVGVDYATPVTVYFDIGSFDTGRESKRVAVAAAAAAVH